ncbi:MAG: 3-phosphoshikimate 1-carboxyvinyltransferase [Acidobacteriota bacterium]|nr:3-phosphoshikimate 1-carboxyvinyltransferase [Acidobacteriota bacterium]
MISGTVAAPPSKSFMQRVVAAALLSAGITEIINPSFCDDSLASLRIAQDLGAKIWKEGDRLKIKGGIKPVKRELNCGESGLCLRMFPALASLTPQEIILTGSGTLLRRPVGMMEKPLQTLGVQCESQAGYPPLRLKGPLRGGKAMVDGSTTSQFLTGLLLALPCAKGDSVLEVESLKSKAYIDITLKVSSDFGISIVNENYRRFYIRGEQKFQAREYRIEGDWSAAAFLLVAGAVGGSVTVGGLDLDSCQGDRKILEALEACGAYVSIDSSPGEAGDREDKENSKRIKVENSALKAFTFDATDCPDLFPPLAVLACACEGLTRIKGVSRLSHKESHRAKVLSEEFSKLGADISINGDWMEIRRSHLSSGIVDPHHDHRMAIAAAVAGIIADGKILIKDPACVSKSYPNFFDDFRKIGGKVDE